METVLTHCAGLDVHQATVVATVRVPDGAGGRRVVTETFGTMTPDLVALREWLQAYGVTHVALESTGVYWKPVYYLLEDAFTLLLINMRHLSHVPGRKTDVQDSEWLAQLLEYGLLRASFVPPPAIRELREVARYRVQQVRDRAQEVNRLCKVLEDAGLKLTSVASDVLGASGRAMITALVEGTTDPQVLADLARGKLRKKLPELRRALQGRFRPVHAFLLEQILAKIDFLDETLDRITDELDQRLAPFEPMLTALDTIPGVDRIGALSIVAETGGTCRDFRPPHTSAVGPPCVPARTKAPVNGIPGKRGEAIAISARRSFNPRSARCGPKARPCKPAITASNAIVATRKPSWPSRIRFSKSRTTSCVTG